MADPIEIKIVGTDDSGPALKSAQQGIKSMGDAAKDAERPLKKTGESLADVGKEAKRSEGDLRKVGDSGEKAGVGLRGMGADAKRAEADLEGLGDSTRRINKFVGDGGRAFGEYGTGLGGVGDRMDEVDTRAMGVADGFAGLTDAMKWNQLTAQEQAMVFSDFGSSMYNAVIPSLQSGSKALKGWIGDLGGIKSVLIGAGTIAAIGALAYGLNEAAQEARDAKFDEVAKDLAETGDSAKAAREALGGEGPDFTNMFSTISEDASNLQQVMARLVNEGNFDEARDLIREAGERGDITADQMAGLTQQLNQLEGSSSGAAAEQANLAESIRGVSDAWLAQSDPVFAVIDADNQLRDANQGIADALGAVNDAIKEHGENSPEVLEATQALRDAQLEAAEAALGSEGALRELTAAAVENPSIVADVIAHLQRLADKGEIAQGSVDTVARALRDVPRRTDSTLAAHDAATRTISGVRNALASLNGRRADVTVAAHIQSAFGSGAANLLAAMFASGGVKGAAVGGGHRGLTLVGEDGPELIDMQPGTMVRPASNTGHMLNGAGGGGVTLSWGGGPSDALGRAIWDWLRENVQVSYGGDVQRALGRG